MADTLIPVKAKYTGADVTSLGEYASGEKIPVTYIPSIEGTTVASTGETGTVKFLRVDGDGTCSWQTTPDTDTVYTHPNHSGEVTSTSDGATVIAADVVDEANLKVSNAPTNGYVLTAQSGNTGGLTWAADSTTDSTKLPLAGGTMTGSVKGSTDTDTTNTGSVTLNFTTNQNFVLTLTGNVTLANPTTEQVGQSGFIVFTQDGTGSRTVGLGNQYYTAGTHGLTLTATASAIDLVPYIVVATDKVLLGKPQLAFVNA